MKREHEKAARRGILNTMWQAICQERHRQVERVLNARQP